MFNKLKNHIHPESKIPEIAAYWNERIHDLEIATHPVGSLGFFQELADYRFDKLHYLQTLIDFSSFKGKKVLEIGCGAAIDGVLFAENGADYTGIDLSGTAIDLAQKNFKLRQLSGKFEVGNGESLRFSDEQFDVVYIHGVLQYTANPVQMIEESYRVLKPGGQVIVMVYNRHGWLNLMSCFFKVGLEHEDAPVLEKYTSRELKNLFSIFPEIIIIPERFPVKSRLHGGLKGFLFNTLFVGAFNAIPRALVRQWGWHLMGFAKKGSSES